MVSRVACTSQWNPIGRTWPPTWRRSRVCGAPTPQTRASASVSPSELRTDRYSRRNARLSLRSSSSGSRPVLNTASGRQRGSRGPSQFTSSSQVNADANAFFTSAGRVTSENEHLYRTNCSKDTHPAFVGGTLTSKRTLAPHTAITAVRDRCAHLYSPAASFAGSNENSYPPRELTDSTFTSEMRRSDSAAYSLIRIADSCWDRVGRSGRTIHSLRPNDSPAGTSPGRYPGGQEIPGSCSSVIPNRLRLGQPEQDRRWQMNRQQLLVGHTPYELNEHIPQSPSLCGIHHVLFPGSSALPRRH